MSGKRPLFSYQKIFMDELRGKLNLIRQELENFAKEKEKEKNCELFGQRKPPIFEEILTGAFWGITVFFNPTGYKNKIENYRRFRESSKKQGLNLLCVELAFGGKNFEVSKEDADILVQLRGGDILWQKERLLNIGLERLPKDCDKIAWLDCDIIFENDNWLKETSQLLKKYVIIQPFSFCVRLPESGFIKDFSSLPFGNKENQKSCGSAYVISNPEIRKKIPEYLEYGHPGFAWAARKKVFDELNFYDKNILGFSDNMMVYAFYGIETKKNWISCSAALEKDLRKWVWSARRMVKGSVFFVQGNIFHLWHGNHADRRYGRIDNLIKEYDFDPDKDIKLNENKVWVWATDKKELHKKIKDYFFDRMEEGERPKKIKLYSYCTPSHEGLKNNWFLPSIKDNYELIIKDFSQNCPSARFLENGWEKIIDRKIDMLIGAIKENWNDIFIFSDVDVQFFGETEKTLLEELGDRDILFQKNRSNPLETESICTGFFILRANSRTLQLWEEVRKIREQNPEFIGCQAALNYVIKNEKELQWGFLSECFWSPGVDYGKKNWLWEPGMNFEIPKNILLHHANWTRGVENKIKQLEYVKNIKESQKPKISLSVITPVYNRAEFIKKCIENVISQNCERAEHIIIDGGSTDGTAKIIKSYALQYPHIKWISEKDSGQSDAMNKGIRMARGGIISFLNSDDFYEPNVFGRVLDIFEGLPEPSFVYGNCNIWQKIGNKEPFLKEKWAPSKALRYEDMIIHFGGQVFPPNPSGYFYHKSLHEKAGYYNEKLHYALDVDFVYRAFSMAKVKYINEDLGNFYLAENTKTFQNCFCGKRIWGEYEDNYYNNLPRMSLKNMPFLKSLNIILKIKIKNAINATNTILGQFFY